RDRRRLDRPGRHPPGLPRVPGDRPPALSPRGERPAGPSPHVLLAGGGLGARPADQCHRLPPPGTSVSLPLLSGDRPPDRPRAAPRLPDPRAARVAAPPPVGGVPFLCRGARAGGERLHHLRRLGDLRPPPPPLEPGWRGEPAAQYRDTGLGG